MVVAAVAYPTRALVGAATGDQASLDAAFDSNVLLADGDALRFVHPLVAAAAYEYLSPVPRRALHARLAELVDDSQQRARHLALAATGPDEFVAIALEAAAADARARGSTATAADLMERASGLTAPGRPEDRHRRTLAAGRLRFADGDTLKARRLLDQAVATAPSRGDRAEALCALARLQLYEGDQPGAADVSAAALREPTADTAVRADAGALLSAALLFMREDLHVAAGHAAAATDLSRRTADRELRANTISMSALLQVVIGRPEAFQTLREAERLGDPPRGRPVIAGPSFHRAVMLLWTDGAQEAAALLDGVHERALAYGDEASLPLILTESAVAAYHSGQWPKAARLADEGHQLALQTGQRHQQAFGLAVRALVGAAQGRVDEARADAAGALALAGDRAMAVARVHAHWALAMLDLSLGRPREVADRLGELRRRQLDAGVREPGLVPFLADEAEAAIVLGRSTHAEAVLDWLEERAAG